MSVYLDDGDCVLHHGDALTTLRELPSSSVHCIVTSPPFWALRDYGVDGQIGLEATPGEWCDALVAVFREARRVLRPDGVAWIEVGDTYANSGASGPQRDHSGGLGARDLGTRGRQGYGDASGPGVERTLPAGIKAKDLVGAPWLLAFALRADGWCLRSDVVWNRPNPMPESVTDRPTKAHSMVFLLTKATWVGAEQPMPMRDVDAAWLAALIDGEGSICFQERQNVGASPTVSVRLSIVNTNRALLDRVAEITSIEENQMPSPRRRNDGTEGRPIFTWQVTNAKAARVLAAVRPYLIAKRVQADLGLYVHDLNQRHKGRGGHVTTRADLGSKRRAAAACSDLNRGIPVDLSWFNAPKPGRWVPNPYAYDADAIREPARRAGEAPGGNRAGVDEWKVNGGWAGGEVPAMANANARSVWTIPTEPTPFAHFATFPQQLAARCIQAGTSEHGCCAKCGAPWTRTVERTPMQVAPSPKRAGWQASGDDHARTQVGGTMTKPPTSKTVGWAASCACNATVQPCTILDPFAGSATTLLVARRHGRRSIGIELSAEYLAIAATRLQQLSLLGGDAA